MFLIASTAEAQVRSARPSSRAQEVFRGGTPGFRQSPMRQTFRSFPRQGIVVAPQVPYYPYDPYYANPPYYSQPAYSASDTNAEINSLNDEIQRLQVEVQRLQDELAVARTQMAQPSPVQLSPPMPPPPVTPTVLVFRDGHQIETQGYAVIGETLWTSYEDGFRKIAISDLNLDATRKENLKRGSSFLPER
jgi:hypothetical protein